MSTKVPAPADPEYGLIRRDLFERPFFGVPFFRDVARQMEHFFDDVGFRRGREKDLAIWAPEIEIVQQGEELRVTADLPGLNPEDVKVEVVGDEIAIRGERKKAFEEKAGGYYRSERSYGQFYRVIPLPEGALTDAVSAAFKDGVLTVTVPVPPRVTPKSREVKVTVEPAAKEARA